MKGTTTYLHFTGHCRAAMALYRECFGGDVQFMPYPEASGNPNPAPDAPVQHSALTHDGQAFLMASDYPPGAAAPSYTGGHFSVFVDCSSDAEVETFFKALSKGGRVTVPPSDMHFGRFAMCEDPFGVSWILNCAKAA